MSRIRTSLASDSIQGLLPGGRFTDECATEFLGQDLLQPLPEHRMAVRDTNVLFCMVIV